MSPSISLDVRWPLGLLFALIGLLLVGYGLLYDNRPPAANGLHINVWWGGVLVIFGMSVLWLARRAARSRGPAR